MGRLNWPTRLPDDLEEAVAAYGLATRAAGAGNTLGTLPGNHRYLLVERDGVAITGEMSLAEAHALLGAEG